MWTRSLLKQNAKEALKRYYWVAFAVCLVAGLLGGSSRGGFSMPNTTSSYRDSSSSYSSSYDDDFSFFDDDDDYDYDDDYGDHGDDSFSAGDAAFLVGIIGISLVIFVVVYAIAMAIAIFLGNPVQVGKNRFFCLARNGDVKFDHLFDQFKSGRYLPTVKTMFFKTLYEFLWGLLFVIPGIIKSYEYALIPYLLAENPYLPKERAFEISKQTMDGEKWNLFVLGLSFLGWQLLGAMMCGVGVLFVNPYVEATFAEFYMCMRAKMLSFGYTTEEELTGGLPNGFTVPAQSFDGMNGMNGMNSQDPYQM
ncbi:MAG: DUF975 family protein [Oscillospiraceae bacterium]|nr:DUF975 family protein [Oscillospiraceae bacterium]